MPERESLLTGADWAWLHDLCPPEVGCVTFARGVTPEQMIASFGLDPALAVWIDDSGPPSGYPTRDDQDNLVCPIIYAGRGGDWAFAIDADLLTLEGTGGGTPLPPGTEEVMVMWTQTIDTFSYSSGDGRSAQFEPLLDDPEVFLAEAGLDIDAAEEVDLEEAEYPYLAALDMMKLAIGLDVPASAADGPLLYCQRPPAGA